MNSILGSVVGAHSPLIRGMISYAVIWPACSIAQEYLEHGTTLANADWARATRFGIFGSLFLAPVWHNWIKYTNRFFKQRNFTTALKRSLIEQLSYSPVATAYFYFGMSALERKPFDVCVQEVKEKFWPTYRIGLLYWPIVQTINFYFISKKNRLVFLSVASFVWMMFMAHMKDEKGKGFEKMSILPTESGSVNKDLIKSLGNDMKEDTTENETTTSENKRSSLIPVIQAIQGKEKSKSSTTAITYLVVGSEDSLTEKDFKFNLEINEVQEIPKNKNLLNSDSGLRTTNDDTHETNLKDNILTDLIKDPKTLQEQDEELNPDIDDIVPITPNMVDNKLIESDLPKNMEVPNSPQIAGQLPTIAVMVKFDEINSKYSKEEEAISQSPEIKEETETLPADKQIRVVTFVDEIEDISTLVSDQNSSRSDSDKNETVLDDVKPTQEEVETERVILQKPMEDLFGATVDISCSDNLARSVVRTGNQNTVPLKVIDMVNLQTSVQDEIYDQTECNESLG